MRVLHVIPQFPYFGGATIVGGHASCLFTLARTQDGSDVEPTILSYVHERGGSIPITPTLEVVSLFERAAPGTARYGLRFLHAARAWARRRRGAFDLVHVHSGFADYLLVSSRLKSILERPVVHSMYCPLPAAGHRVNRPLMRRIILRAARGLDAFTAMSENTAGSMRAYGLGPPDVDVVPPPLDLKRFRPPREPSPRRAELGLAEDDVAVLFVGNAKPQKNLSGVLRAIHLARAAGARVRLVATTELPATSTDEQLARLRAEMEDLGLASEVIQLGIVEDMPELMRACDLLVAPFLDSFGPSDYFMAVLEAMACGRPVIVSTGGGMPEIIDAEVGRLVEPTDEKAMAEAIVELAGDTELRGRLGAAARARAETTFAPDRVAASFREIYERALAP